MPQSLLCGYSLFITLPLLTLLPIIVYGWDTKLFGILLSAFFSGVIIEDFFWFVVNPVVKLSEWRTSFTDYYPWIKINKIKIIPVGYLFSILVAVLSWLLLWR